MYIELSRFIINKYIYIYHHSNTQMVFSLLLVTQIGVLFTVMFFPGDHSEF